MTIPWWVLMLACPFVGAAIGERFDPEHDGYYGFSVPFYAVTGLLLGMVGAVVFALTRWSITIGGHVG